MAAKRIPVARDARAGWTVSPTFAQDHVDAHPGGSAQVGQLYVPPAFELVVMQRDPDDVSEAQFLAVLMYAVEEGAVGLRGVYSSTHDVDDALAWLRKVQPLEEWRKEAFALMAASEADRGAELIDEILTKHAGVDPRTEEERTAAISHAIRTAIRTPLRRRRNRITPAHLREVAAIYRGAAAAGEPPTMAVKDHFQVSHSTAARWVGEARKVGELNPADGSRGGEIDG